MMANGPEAEDLRRSLLGAAESGRRSGGCPEPGEFWDAQRGGTSPARARELVEHTVRCPSCAEAWRVAHAMGAMEGPSVARGVKGAWTGWRTVAAAAAAVLLVAVGLVVLLPPGGRDADIRYRSGRGLEIESETRQDVPLPRDGFVLRWSPGPEGTVYRVDLTTESFAAVARADGLEEARWQVPESALAGIDGGTRLYWRVEALLPDGRTVRSETFVVALE